MHVNGFRVCSAMKTFGACDRCDLRTSAGDELDARNMTLPLLLRSSEAAANTWQNRSQWLPLAAKQWQTTRQEQGNGGHIKHTQRSPSPNKNCRNLRVNHTAIACDREFTAATLAVHPLCTAATSLAE